MAGINTVNNSLDGVSGLPASNFCGHNSPTLSGDIDYGSCDSLIIPNSGAPSLSVNGAIAIDTTFTGHQSMLTYYSTSQQYVPSILPADLSTTDNHAVVYDSASSKFVMAAQPSGGGAIIQVTIGASTALDSTTSATFVDTSLSASITPLSASSNLWIRVYGSAVVTGPDGDNDGRFEIQKTSGTPGSLAQQTIRIDDLAVTSEDPFIYSSLYMSAIHASEGISLHSFTLRFRRVTLNTTTSFAGDTCPGRMIIMELS